MSVESAQKALKDLSFAMQIDPELAWAWHCNIAMVAQDACAPHNESNERAADFMRRVFDVDTTMPPIKPEPYNAEPKESALTQMLGMKGTEMAEKTMIIDVEPTAWMTKVECIGPHYGNTTYSKLPIQSLQPGFYSHEKLYSEKTVIGLMKAAYYDGYTDRDLEDREKSNQENAL